MMQQTVPSMAPSSLPYQRSPWHSPVPYLFGGLAAMLGLIAFALLILACSYWKLSGDMENRHEGERDLEAGDSKGDQNDKDLVPPFEEKYLVIMAGQANPTFIATPVSSRASSFGSCGSRDTSTCSDVSSNLEDEKQVTGS
ncbi:protein GLUTAMINE DUMPER 2-like [Rutidosis leptorrhynchoides]|uniref:protein GLUTAMINE DUMPER 2-like n=1 Tax=Rutidosis leptorrhynchoides TaxID=125765 RepID=UPI003A993282